MRELQSMKGLRTNRIFPLLRRSGGISQGEPDEKNSSCSLYVSPLLMVLASKHRPNRRRSLLHCGILTATRGRQQVESTLTLRDISKISKSLRFPFQRDKPSTLVRGTAFVYNKP